MKPAFLVLLAVIFLCPFDADAQAEASANVSVTIVAPITLSRNSDLEIPCRSGAVSVSRNEAARGHAAGMQPATSSYRISGAPDACYSVSVSPLVAVRRGTSTIQFSIQACTDSGKSYLPRDGADLIYVSAAGSSASRAEGAAASAAADFQLTVNYN